MKPTRVITDLLRDAGLWLAVVSLLAGPLGVGAFVAADSAKTCGVSCPCDEQAHAEAPAHIDDDCDGSCEVACDDETSCDDDCPDDCGDCACCPGLMAGLLPIVLPGLPGPSASPPFLASPDAPASGKMSGVFRPPRSLI